MGLIDVFIRQGLYRDQVGLPQPPYVPGLEVAGRVRALGDGVAGFEVGEPVVTLSANSGTRGYAAIFISDAAYVASMKDVNLDPALAVAVVPNGATAHLALTQIARIRDGERVLVHGALGGLAAGFPGVARQLDASRVAVPSAPGSGHDHERAWRQPIGHLAIMALIRYLPRPRRRC